MGKSKIILTVLNCIIFSLFFMTGCGNSEQGYTRIERYSENAESFQWPENPQQTYTLRVATAINDKTPAGQTLMAIQKELEVETNGAVVLDIFWESTLGGATEIAEGVKIGSIDIGLLSSAVISGYTPTIDVFSLPFIISSREQFKAIVDQHFDEVTAGIKENIGYPLGLWEFGYRHLVTKDKEVRTLEDCKGITIRVMDGQVYSSTFKALGCIPSNIELNELVPALQQGAIDGVEEPLAMLCNQQQYSFCKYLAMIGYNYSVGCPVMSQMTIEKMPLEVNMAVKDVFKKYQFYSVDVGKQFEEDSLKICEEKGMTIHYLSEEELNRFKDAVKPIWKKYSDTIGQDLIDLVSEIDY